MWSQYGNDEPFPPGRQLCEFGYFGGGAGGAGGGIGPGFPVHMVILEASDVSEHSWTLHCQSTTYIVTEHAGVRSDGRKGTLIRQLQPSTYPLKRVSAAVP